MECVMRQKIKIGIVGAGGQRCCFHGGCVFQNVDNVQIAGLCDIREDRLAHAKEMYENNYGYVINCFTDFNKMYRQAGLDAVYVAGPNYLHQDMAVSALQAGLHVLCEKPFELNIERSRRIMETAKNNNLVLALAMQMHYRRRYHKIGEMIANGEIGKIAQAWCTEYRPTYAAIKDWVWNPALSGGAILEKNCHHYDILSLWVKSRPTTVYATGNILKHFEPHGYKSQIVDNAWIVNDYENGARAMVGINFMAEGCHLREFGVVGTEGKISFSSTDGEIIHVVLNNGDHYDLTINGEIRGGLFQDFVDCIVQRKRQPLVTPEKGIESLLVPMAAELSIKEKRVVHINELR
jgi:predicted dehydrogenase